MRVSATVCSKGGVGKTTTTANLGGLLADAGLRVLLIDLDSQPTLSSYYELSQPAPGGLYELLATELVDLDQIISQTAIPNLDIIVSNDYRNQLQQLLLNAPNGRFRLIDLLDRFADRYDAILIDTQGARSVILEMAVMAADCLISPIVPELLTAREFVRGTQGMLNEHTGLHFNLIDMAWKNWFTVRKYARAATNEERADIWTTVDSELERLRHPQERHLYPPKPDTSPGSSSSGKSSGASSLPSTAKTSRGGSEPTDGDGELDPNYLTFGDGQSDLDPTPEPSPARGVPDAGGVGESVAMKQMRAQLEQLEQRNAELEAQTQRTPVAPQGGSFDDDWNGSAGGLLDTDGLLQEHTPQPSRSAEEQATIATDLTLSPHHETEGHRQLRHWQAKERGEEAIDFEAAALKSVPLQDGGRVAPITDLWHVPAWRRNAQDLRMQIGEVVQVLASWAGIEASGSSDVIRLNARNGIGYELGPLEGAPSRRAQLVWQLLAGLEGNIDPVMPSDISLLGELVGSHGDDTEVRLPDGLFVRVFWLTRLIRVLRDVLNAEGDS